MHEYFREVERTGEPLVVTDHGREVLEVRPIRKCSTVQDVLAEYRAGPGKGCAEISTVEILASVPTEEWEALRDESYPVVTVDEKFHRASSPVKVLW